VPRHFADSTKSRPQSVLARMCREAGLPVPVEGYPLRRGLAVTAWPEVDLALVVSEAVPHRRVLNLIATEGWRALIVTPKELADGRALDLVKRAL